MVARSVNRNTALSERVASCRTVLAAWADAVDRERRFPAESIEALRSARLLSCAVPEEFGGDGASLPELVEATRALGRECSSTAMIFAMHQSQTLCLINHGGNDRVRDMLRRLCAEQFLVGSATTETGIGGDVRSSGCAVVAEGEHADLKKVAPVISYGEYAEIVLATARRTPDSPPNDQVLVACERAGMSLDRISDWKTLGMRGTCSPGFTLTARVTTDAVLADGYDIISRETMLPVSHILWAAAWLGISDAALAKATKCVQSAARRTPGATPPGATRLAELHLMWQRLVDAVVSATAGYQRTREGEDVGSATFAAMMFNALKINAATSTAAITTGALKICGIAGYQEDSTLSMSRLLRDSLSASVMINDDRILANNAQLSLLMREIPLQTAVW